MYCSCYIVKKFFVYIYKINRGCVGYFYDIYNLDKYIYKYKVFCYFIVCMYMFCFLYYVV